MKILTKLMLASSVMVTSGFAVDPDPVVVTDDVIDGTIKIESGAEWETTKDHTITSTGAVTLEKADVEGEGARWIISEGNTINVQGGSVTVVGEDAYGPTINLDGTMKLTKTSAGGCPEINLNGTEIGSNEVFKIDATTIELEKLFTAEENGLDSYKFTYNGYNMMYDHMGHVYYYIGEMDFSLTADDPECERSFWGIGVNDPFYIKIHMDPEIPNNLKYKLEFKDGTYDEAVYEGLDSYYQYVSNDKEYQWRARTNLAFSGGNYAIAYYMGDVKQDEDNKSWSGKIYLAEPSYSGGSVTNVTKGYGGLLDASPLRSFAQTATAVEDLSSNISGINPSALGEVKLPFNCKFGTKETPGMNLSNVDKVSFTKFVKGKTYEPEVVSNIIGMKEIAGGTYGDYSNDVDLGVVLPTEASKLAVTEEKTDDGVDKFDLGTIAEDGSYNISAYRINTTYLSANAHALAGDFTYNVGFTGNGNPIKISGTNKVATFKGDASEYAPNGNITLTNKTVYAGNNSFIKKSHAYGELEFAAAASEDPEDALVNEIPSGVEVSATKFSVGKGHTLTVKGKLRA